MKFIIKTYNRGSDLPHDFIDSTSEKISSDDNKSIIREARTTSENRKDKRVRVAQLDEQGGEVESGAWLQFLNGEIDDWGTKRKLVNFIIEVYQDENLNHFDSRTLVFEDFSFASEYAQNKSQSIGNLVKVIEADEYGKVKCPGAWLQFKQGYLDDWGSNIE